MSYNKMMKWQRRHPKGTNQPVIMHANSGFWPSKSFLDKYFKYQEECQNKGITPLECEAYYKSQLK